MTNMGLVTQVYATQGEDVRARVLHAAAKTKRVCGYSCATPSRWSRSRGVFRRRPASPAAAISRSRLDMQIEVEFKLGVRFQVSPQIAGEIKAVAGVEIGGDAVRRMALAVDNSCGQTTGSCG